MKIIHGRGYRVIDDGGRTPPAGGHGRVDVADAAVDMTAKPIADDGLKTAKEHLDALTRTLMIPVPALLAFAAAVVAGERIITVQGLKLPAFLAQIVLMLFIALCLLNGARLAFALGRLLRQAGTARERIAAMLASDTAQLNPFARLSLGLGFLPPLLAGFVIGFSATLIFPIAGTPYDGQPAFAWLLVGLAVLYTAGFLGALLAIGSVLLDLRHWGAVAVLMLGFLLGGGASYLALTVVEDLRAPTPVGATPAQAR